MNKYRLLRSYAYSAVWKRNMCQPPSESNVRGPMTNRYKPTDLQKFILVWTKKFKTKEEIPKLVSYVSYPVLTIILVLSMQSELN